MIIETNNTSSELKERKTFCIKHNCNKKLQNNGRWVCSICNREYAARCKYKKSKLKSTSENNKISQNLEAKQVKVKRNSSKLLDPFQIIINKAFIDNDKESLNVIMKVILEKLSH